MGALANHLYLLELDRADLPEPAQESVRGARAACDGLTATLDLVRTFVEAGERELTRTHVDAAGLGALVGEDLPADVTLETDLDALRHVLDDLRADGALVSREVATDSIRWSWRSKLPMPGGSAALEGQLDPFDARCVVPRWACAAQLAPRVGAALDLCAGTDAFVHGSLTLPITTRTTG